MYSTLQLTIDTSADDATHTQYCFLDEYGKGTIAEGPIGKKLFCPHK